MSDTLPVIALIGGSGDLGGGLAYRWAKAAYPIVIGSRSPDKGAAAARELGRRVPGASVRGTGNLEAAAAADVVVLSVPFAHHAATLEQIKDALPGKILIDVTVPLVPPKVSRVTLPDQGSVAKATQQALGEEVRVVSAFHTVAAAHLGEDAGHVHGDVLVCGNDPAARETVISLVRAAGLRGWHAGPIDNSVVGEALTSVLIFINRKYKIDGAGIQIVGEPKADA